MKVFISYRDDSHRAADRLAVALERRGVDVRHLNGSSPTGYDGQAELARDLEDHDAIVFIVDETPSWRQRSALTEAIRLRWDGEDIRLLTVRIGHAALPGVLDRCAVASTSDPGWERAVLDALLSDGGAVAAESPQSRPAWAPDVRAAYLETLDGIVRQAAADAVPV